MGGSPSRILNDSLIQGGSDVLKNKGWFEEKGITHVVSICDETPGDHIIPKERRIHIDLLDCTSSNLSEHFEVTTKFIHEARRDGGRVYVHCAAGISRSSTITLAYMMSWLELEYNEALTLLRQARNAISPNEGFRQQLQEFHAGPLCKKLRELLKEEREKDERLLALYKEDLKRIEELRESFNENNMRN